MTYVLEHDLETGEWVASVDGNVVAVDPSAAVAAAALGAELQADAVDAGEVAEVAP